MKIVICSQSDTPQGKLDSRFGRTAFWGIFDDLSKQWEFIANHQNLQAVQGAGIQAAQAVLDAGAQVLIACNVGPKAMAVLTASGVEVFQAESQMSLEQAVNVLKEGKLKQMENANVQGHWI